MYLYRTMSVNILFSNMCWWCFSRPIQSSIKAFSRYYIASVVDSNSIIVGQTLVTFDSNNTVAKHDVLSFHVSVFFHSPNIQNVKQSSLNIYNYWRPDWHFNVFSYFKIVAQKTKYTPKFNNVPDNPIS